MLKDTVFHLTMSLGNACAMLGAIICTVLLGAAPSRASELLEPIIECPDNEAGDTCDVGGLAWYGLASKAPIRRKVSNGTVIKQFQIVGRLNGGTAKRYALTFSQSADDYFASTNHSGVIAYETASRGDQHLVIRTNRGSLHVLSNFGIEPAPHVVVVDERSWTVLARYSSPCVDLSFLSANAPFWDEGRGVCVAPAAQPHQSTSATTCKKPKRLEVCAPYQPPASFVPATGTRLESIDTAIRDFRTLRLNANNPEGTYYGGSGWSVRAYRVTGTPYLVLRGLCGDCDE